MGVGVLLFLPVLTVDYGGLKVLPLTPLEVALPSRRPEKPQTIVLDIKIRKKRLLWGGNKRILIEEFKQSIM